MRARAFHSISEEEGSARHGARGAAGLAASRDRASASATGSDEGGGSGAASSHSGRRFHTRNASLDGAASGRPSAAETNSAQPQPAWPMRAASPAASRFNAVSRPWARRCNIAATRSGSSAAAASRPRCGGSKSSARASPRGVGAAVRAGKAKANSSSRSNAGIPRRPRRRNVAGAWTSSGGGRPRRWAAASTAGNSNSSPSAVKIAARPCPATTDGASGSAMRAMALGGMRSRTMRRAVSPCLKTLSLRPRLGEHRNGHPPRFVCRLTGPAWETRA